VARAGAAARGEEAVIAGRGQRTVRRVEREHEDAVQALVGDDDVSPGGIEDDVMRLGVRLLAAIRAGLAGQRQQLRMVAQQSIGADRQHGHGAARVVGDNQPLAGGVDRLANAVAATGGAAVQRTDAPARGVDREG
jgi:hypothetical protein